MNKVIVNKDRCKGCGICVAFCPVQVFTQDEDGIAIPTYVEKCIGCKMCVMRCPDFAVTVIKEGEEE